MDSDSTNKYIPDHRRTNFKNKGRFNPDELRRRRETQSVELRKAKRDETLAKRRNFNVSNANDSDDEDDAKKNDDDSSFLSQLQQELPRMMEQIQSDNFDSQLAATVKFRQILSRERNPPIDLVIQSGVVPRLVGFMSDQPEMLQLEAAWALTNIASGSSDQTRYVVEAGAVPSLLTCCIQTL